MTHSILPEPGPRILSVRSTCGLVTWRGANLRVLAYSMPLYLQKSASSVIASHPTVRARTLPDNGRSFSLAASCPWVRIASSTCPAAHNSTSDFIRRVTLVRGVVSFTVNSPQWETRTPQGLKPQFYGTTSNLKYSLRLEQNPNLL